MSESKVRLYYTGDEPGGVEGVPKTLHFGDDWLFTKEKAEYLLTRVRKNWSTEVEYRLLLQALSRDNEARQKRKVKRNDH